MKYKKLGLSGIKVSSLCLGTMTFGEQTSKAEAFNMMDYAFEKGVNFIDTAEIYPVYPKKETSGKTEEIIGDWLKIKKNRSKVVIATKIASGHPKGVGATGLKWIRGGVNKLGFDIKNMNKAIDGSLKRLKTDYVDLYQLHWPERNVAVFGQLDYEFDPLDNKWTPIIEVLENLAKLINAGKIRQIGLSNETPWGIIKYLNTSLLKNLPRVVSVQNGYNLVNRIFDIANSEVSIRENCGLLAYSPLAGGRLSGKYINKKKPDNCRYTLWPKRFSRHHTTRGERAIKKYVELAKKYNILPSKFANAFVNSRPFVTSNIIGARSLHQLKENIQSIDVSLSSQILKEINDIHLSDPNPCF
jgi:aryl-alcohol dehydrogenase-like predicted oxidoreductase